jgi:hypothetical protein
LTNPFNIIFFIDISMHFSSLPLTLHASLISPFAIAAPLYLGCSTNHVASHYAVSWSFPSLILSKAHIFSAASSSETN